MEINLFIVGLYFGILFGISLFVGSKTYVRHSLLDGVIDGLIAFGIGVVIALILAVIVGWSYLMYLGIIALYDWVVIDIKPSKVGFVGIILLIMTVLGSISGNKS